MYWKVASLVMAGVMTGAFALGTFMGHDTTWSIVGTHTYLAAYYVIQHMDSKKR